MTQVIFTDLQGTVLLIYDECSPQELERQILAGTWTPSVQWPWDGNPVSIDVYDDRLIIKPLFKLNTKLPVPRLTTRELEVIQGLADGLEYKEIGQRLSISPRTVKSYVATLEKKLNATTSTMAVARAVGFGLIKPNLD